MAGNYWSTVLKNRISRRRAMYTTAAGASAAAFLAACGSGNDNKSSSSGSSAATSGPSSTSGAASGASGASGASSSLITKEVDTSAQAKAGGTLTDSTNREPQHFDGQAQGQVQLNFFNSLAYESLVKNQVGHLKPSGYSDVDPQLAQSWEFNGDGTQLTFKLRQGVKWQNRPPVSGRAFDAEDVLQSWNRYVGLVSNDRAVMANSLNPSAPIVSITAPDTSTVVVKLSEPTSYLLQRFTSMVTGELGSIYPREADNGFDPKQDQIGTGGYMLDKFEPSVTLDYKKNPDYWDKKAAYPDQLHVPVIPEYATGLAQFTTGGINAYRVVAEDQLQTKQDTPNIGLYAVHPTRTNPLYQMRFGWQPIDGQKSPFLDIRVRQALSMSLDRDTYIDTFFNVSKFKDAGIPVNTYYATSMAPVPDWSLDPRDTKTFGENAKYYKFDLTQAKQLFEAAKSAYGGDFPAIPAASVDIFATGAYGQETEVMNNFARALGFTVNGQTIVYNKDYLPHYVTQRGQFVGILYGIGATPSADTTDFYVWKYYSKSGETSGALGFGGPDGSLGDGSGDPQVDTMIESARHELDITKRQKIIGDLQRYLAKEQYGVSPPGSADTFNMAWPVLGNYNVFQGESRTVSFTIPGLMNLWLDESKPSKP
ncbi:MAG TPA: ABC transporter substrate-binding protein [Dehalococcoidia bacterium]|nr:ABC transporter substrate-binding protein [Dehalococcoidia bacterium]